MPVRNMYTGDGAVDVTTMMSLVVPMVVFVAACGAAGRCGVVTLTVPLCSSVYTLRVLIVLIIPPPGGGGGGGGVYWIHLVRPSVCLSVCPSVRPSVRPSVCRRHGFRCISQLCFGISIWNFICVLMVAIGRSLLIFSDVSFKMAVWWPYWMFWFPNSNFTLALNINFKLQLHNTYVYG